jgi:hypothetical protein
MFRFGSQGARSYSRSKDSGGDSDKRRVLASVFATWPPSRFCRWPHSLPLAALMTRHFLLTSPPPRINNQHKYLIGSYLAPNYRHDSGFFLYRKSVPPSPLCMPEGLPKSSGHRVARPPPKIFRPQSPICQIPFFCFTFIPATRPFNFPRAAMRPRIPF